MNTMAGLEDYRYYAMLEKDSPFWERKQMQERGDAEQSKAAGEDDFGYQKMTRPRNIELTQSPIRPSTSLEELALSVQKTKKLDVSHKSFDSVGRPDRIPWLQPAVTCIESVISHPWIVVRRQCQVHGSGLKYHIFSPTLIPVIVTLSRSQGVSTMFKGVGSTLLLKSIALWVEDFISKILPWPKTLQGCRSVRGLGQHIMLKCLSVTVITPFYSASLVETVQSDIASETPGCLDVFKEGLVRMLSWARPQTGRLLPVWVLVVPTVFYNVGHYLLSSLVQTLLHKILAIVNKEKYHKRGAVPKEENMFDRFFRQQGVRLSACLLADIVFYPFETVLNRLHLQGTRTIVDNLDRGTSVIPILNQYEGVVDCWRTIKMEEGSFGPWKGVGAVILQYAVLFSLLKLGKVMLTEVRNCREPSKQSKEMRSRASQQKLYHEK